MAILLDLRANVNDNLWTTTLESDHPGNGDRVARWTNYIDDTQKFDHSGTGVLWFDPGSMRLPSLDYRA